MYANAGTALISLLFVLIPVLGVVTSAVMFVVGIIRGLLKKGWKILGISILVFVVTVIIYTVLQGIYTSSISPPVLHIQNLNTFQNAPQANGSGGTIQLIRPSQ